jgi:ElaB/YqjD/DUF883 family membrane-anchored ribosome-binding protein
VRAYTDSVDGDVTGEADAILAEAGQDKTELRNLLASLAGLAGHAVMVIAARLEADLGLGYDPEERRERLTAQRTKVLVQCADALLEARPVTIHLPPTYGIGAWPMLRERRSGLDRRLVSDRRRLAPGNPSEEINLRLFGERRFGVADRRSGTDRRRLTGNTPTYPDPALARG